MSEYVVPTTASDAVTGDLGVNAWLVEENYQEYLANPSSVDESWRAYFAGVQQQPTAPSSVSAYTSNGSMPPSNGVQAPTMTPPPAVVLSSAPPAVSVPPVAPPPPVASPPSVAPSPSAIVPDGDEATPLRGAAARIVENMVASLGVPTATSVHPVPAKIIEVNRTLINEHLANTTGKKISFTHIIAYAVVKAVGLVPSMNATFVEDVDGNSTPGVIRHSHIGLGIAIDIERSSGRSLLVPAIKNADTYDFAGFVGAYEELIAKARTNKLSVDDFSGVTLTITNPGTLGTTQSVPRLMRGQGTIVGVGALDFPVEYRATDPKALAALGVGKVVTLTSTYDHRIIQGAESGLFLKYVDEYLVGSRSFYEEIFASLGMTTLPAHLSRDTTSAISDDQNETTVEKQLAVSSLIESYRVHGHRAAHLNPLVEASLELPVELDPTQFGLSVWDLDRRFLTDGVGGKATATLREIVEQLRRSYCGVLTMEYKHVQDVAEQQWLQRAIEAPASPLSPDEQRFVLNRLNDAEIFESFLHTRYVGQKRFGLEGGTSSIPFIDAVLEAAVKSGVHEAVLGMSHRGRLNVLANVIGKSYNEIFGDFEGNLDLSSVQGIGDMKYHKGGSGTWTGSDGSQLPVALVPNPSHLEAVNPVVEGITRSKQDRLSGEAGPAVLAILMHGDASFAGQGVVAETLNLSQLPAYAIGGTVHLVINNQIGFTTPPTSARSSTYATDVAKGIEAPIIHVNGDEPEAVVRAARIAFAYREAFAKDIVVDLVCYRTYGHNEGDDPSYTQPLMYKAIANHEPVNVAYAESLISEGVVTEEDVQSYIAQLNAQLAGALEETRKIPVPHLDHLPEPPVKFVEPLSKETAIDRSTIVEIAQQLSSRPATFTVHPKLARQTEQRDELFRTGEIDWALGEALAFGTVMLEGHNVRLIGQDAQRGTFSHRHSVLVDYETGENYVPLSVLKQYGEGVNVGSFEVYDSLLSEYAALGFEYGYSVDNENTLVLWEAQFGDFANGAQIMIDNFIVAAEEKWGQRSGLVMLLPHGYEGQGPEHSSARLERYLASAAGGNVTIAQPTSSAQYFHLLRAQARLASRRPLIVMTPKFLLRARVARSRIEELVDGSFSEVLDDPSAATLDASSVQRIVCCSGKIAFEAADRRDARLAGGLDGPQSAIIRVEQLYPWPEAQLAAIINRYPNASELVWLQDEPANMGAWAFVYERLIYSFGNHLSVRSVSRAAAGTPATGSHLLHDLEVAYLMDESVGSLPPASA